MGVLRHSVVFMLRIFSAVPVKVEESPGGGPAVTVTLNPLCRAVPYTVELSYGVREEGSGEKCSPQQTVTATLLPGASATLPVNTSALPLGIDQEYCFSVAGINIEGGMYTMQYQNVGYAQ